MPRAIFRVTLQQSDQQRIVWLFTHCTWPFGRLKTEELFRNAVSVDKKLVDESLRAQLDPQCLQILAPLVRGYHIAVLSVTEKICVVEGEP